MRLSTERDKSRFHDLVNEYEQNGDSSEVARIKADNALVLVYRKELRKVFLEYLQWMHAMKKDSTFQKVMQTQKDLRDNKDLIDLIAKNQQNLPLISGNSY